MFDTADHGRDDPARDALARAADGDALDIAPPEGPGRVLVVDDERTIVDLFREFLTGEGYEVSVAATGEEAVRAIPDLAPDIILTDLNMPGMGGLEVMRFARSVDPEVVVVVCTGEATTPSAIEALRQGAYDYIVKPPDLFEVAEIVKRGYLSRTLKEVNRRLLQELRTKNGILRTHEQELRERVRVATWQMTRLYDVGKEISANLELAPRLEMIAGKASELAGARGSVIYLRRNEGDAFVPLAAWGLEGQHVATGEPLAVGASDPVGAAALHQRPVRETAAVGGVPLRVPGAPEAAFNALLAMPMVAEGQVIGVLVLLDKAGGFTRDDENFMALFASQAAVATRNSQLYEHTKSLDRLKSEFVAVVSHEIRTPLTSVKGAVELLSDERYFQNNDQQAKLLTIAHANAERLLVLINDILDFSKLEASSLPMNIERQRLEPVLQQAANNLRTLLDERRMHLEVVMSPELPDLLIDANRIAQVVTNLLSNAIKFSPTSGLIEVTAEPWEGVVRVGVRDHGEGIAAPDMPKLFQKFSQIDSGATRKAGGTGLGLVICKGIIEQHGGRIWVESTPGEGSTFYFTLPTIERRSPEPVS